MVVLCLSLTAWAAPDCDFTISTDYEEPFDEHFAWCIDHHITSEAVPYGFSVPNDKHRKKLIERLQVYFAPNDLVPQQLLELAIKDHHGTVINERDDIAKFIANDGPAVIDWFHTFVAELTQVYHLQINLPKFRCRLYNEVNTFELFEPEDYYYLLTWFYPLFKEHMPPGSTLVISLSGAEGEGSPVDYRNYLRRILLEHCRVGAPNNPLPFDGIDIHGYNTSYQYWSHHYCQLRSVFAGVFPPSLKEIHFNKLGFWALETARAHHGLSQVAWSSCIFEYNDDWDVSRHGIKAITHVLNIPNMMFTAVQPKKRGEWKIRYQDGVFEMMGLKDHGCHIFDKGTRTPIYGVDSIRTFTRHLSQFYPDTSPTHVFSVDNIRRYQFRSRDNKYRLIVWRDFGNEDLESQRISVPFGQYDSVNVLDLITGRCEHVPVQTDMTGAYIFTDLNANPRLITPTLNTDETTFRIVSPFVRSGVSDVAMFENGTWNSILHLDNPNSGEEFVEIHAWLANGTQVGSPYEVAIPAMGSLHLDLGSVFDPFDGFIIVSSTGMIVGQVEHHLASTGGYQGVMSRLIPIPEAEADPVAGRYLTTDWEIDSGLSNLITLINTNDADTGASITVFDETGDQMDTLSRIMSAKSQLTEPVAMDTLGYRYGIVEVETEPGVAGTITRYSSGWPVPVWQEEPLQDDGKMVSELELKASTIADAQAYSRIIISNPWMEDVTGVIQERDAAGVLISETPVTLSGYETTELTLASEAVSSVVFKLDNDIRVFGRREDVIVDTNSQTVTAVSSKSSTPDLALAGALVLPYFVYEDVPESQKETVFRIQNDNEFPVTVTISLFDNEGGLLTEQNLNLSARSTDRQSAAGLFPEGTDQASGSVEIRISQIGGITAQADYIIGMPGQLVPMTMNAQFEHMY